MAKLKTSVRNAAPDAITSALGTTAYFWVSTGSAPGKSGNNFAGNTGTVLAKLQCSNPFAPGASVGVLTASAISSATATASGTPGHWRLCTDNSTTDGSNVIAEGTAGVGSGELNFGSTIASGGTVSISSFTITEGNA